MFAYALSLLMLIQSAAAPTPAAPKDDIKDSLARAESLYYDARFNDSIQLLLHVNEDLRAQPDRLPERINTKLQLALANIGLNDTEKAKSYLVEMYGLDPTIALDPQQFSPKVISLAGDARDELARNRCQSIGEDAKKKLKAGDVADIRNLLGSPDSKCVDMNAIGPDAADLLYKAGLEAYKQADYLVSLQDFQAALKYSPRHELASQYVDLAQGKLQVAEDRAVIQFQKNFDAHQLGDAAANYRQIVAFRDTNLAQAVRQAGDQYRKALTSLVETWNQTCPAGDAATMTALSGEISELLPEPSFGEDIRSQMMPCAKPELKAEVKPDVKQDVKPEVRTVSLTGSSNPCMQIDYRVAMTRLKTRVEPEIPREARSYIQSSPVTVRVKIRIDESGNVTSAETPGGNPMLNNAVKTAVEHWKFSTAMDSNGVRCVDTELPIVVGPLSTR